MHLPFVEGKGHSSLEKENTNSDTALPDGQRNEKKNYLETLQTLPDISVKRTAPNGKCGVPIEDPHEIFVRNVQKTENVKDKHDEKQATADDFKKSLREELSKERRTYGDQELSSDQEKHANMVKTKTTAEQSQRNSESKRDETFLEEQNLPKTNQIPVKNIEAQDLGKIVLKEPDDKQTRAEVTNQSSSDRSRADKTVTEPAVLDHTKNHMDHMNMDPKEKYENHDQAKIALNQVPEPEKPPSEMMEEIPTNSTKTDPIEKDTCADKLEHIRCPSCQASFTGVRQRLVDQLRTHVGKMHFHRFLFSFNF